MTTLTPQGCQTTNEHEFSATETTEIFLIAGFADFAEKWGLFAMTFLAPAFSQALTIYSEL